MKRKGLVLTIGILLTTISLFGFLATYNSKPVLADVKCPPHINPDSLDFDNGGTTSNGDLIELKFDRDGLRYRFGDENSNGTL